MTNDDGLYGVDAGDADDLGVRQDAEPATAGIRRAAQASPEASRRLGVPGTKHDEHASAQA